MYQYDHLSPLTTSMTESRKHSQDIHAAFQKANVTSELVVLEGAGHGFAGEQLTRAVTELVDWFEQHLAAE